MEKIENIELITLTAQEFIDAWKGGYKGVKQEEGKGYWEQDSFRKNRSQVYFSKICIKEDIYLQGFQEMPDILFCDSVINTFWLENCKLKDTGLVHKNISHTKTNLNVLIISKLSL